MAAMSTWVWPKVSVDATYKSFVFIMSDSAKINLMWPRIPDEGQ